MLKNTKQHGFSLLEIAIALVLITILMQTGLSALNQARHIQTYQATADQLKDIKRALLSFVQINSYLPCPDTNSNGLENREADGRCSANLGKLPYLEFGGVGKQDEFGNPFLYAINEKSTNNDEIRNHCYTASLFAKNGSITNVLYQRQDELTRFCSLAQCNKIQNAVPVTCLTTPVSVNRTAPPYFSNLTQPLGTTTALSSSLKVCSNEASNCVSNTALTSLTGNHLPLVVVSFGKNGAATWQNCTSAGANEQENCDNDAYFRQQPLSDEFDDQLIWLTMHEIKSVMRGKLNWHLSN